jgi:hypothetical protein
MLGIRCVFFKSPSSRPQVAHAVHERLEHAPARASRNVFITTTVVAAHHCVPLRLPRAQRIPPRPESVRACLPAGQLLGHADERAAAVRARGGQGGGIRQRASRAR